MAYEKNAASFLVFRCSVSITRENLSRRQASIELAHLQDQRKFILVVDDEEKPHNIAPEMLSFPGYRIEVTVHRGSYKLNPTQTCKRYRLYQNID